MIVVFFVGVELQGVDAPLEPKVSVGHPFLLLRSNFGGEIAKTWETRNQSNIQTRWAPTSYMQVWNSTLQPPLPLYKAVQ